jgi:glutaredoxin
MLRRLFQRRPPPPAVRLRLYTRPDCPLCDEMKAELARARTSRPFVLEEVDITADPRLEARHGLSIPVLEIGGRPAFKGRLTAGEFERRFERRLREGSLPPAGGGAESRADG